MKERVRERERTMIKDEERQKRKSYGHGMFDGQQGTVTAQG